MSRHGYQFVTVESNGVNAFFIDPGEFDAEFARNLHGLEFQENCSHAREYKLKWAQQFELIKNFDFVELNE